MKTRILIIAAFLAFTVKATIFNNYWTTNSTATIAAGGAAQLGVSNGVAGVFLNQGLFYSGSSTNVFVDGTAYRGAAKVNFELSLIRPAFVMPTNWDRGQSFTIDIYEPNVGTYTVDYPSTMTPGIYAQIATNGYWHNLSVFHISIYSPTFIVGNITNFGIGY
jgi:hypothetical protein